MAKKKTKKVMTITRERALKLFSYFNYKTAGKWDSKRMAGKLMKLPESIDLNLVKNSTVKAILTEITNASSVEVVSGEKEKVESKPTKKKETTAGPVPRKKETKKKDSKKPTKEAAKKKKSRFTKKETKKKVGKSNKEKIYECFLKVKSDKALNHIEKWWKMVNKEVKLTTIKSWVNRWKKGKGLPACARKGKQK